MLDLEKKELLDSMVPKAVLKALTKRAKHSIIRKAHGQDIVVMFNYPFKIGREARVKYVGGEVILQERHKLGGHEPNNDVYLFDDGELLQISRGHCSIIKEYDTYILEDRGSSCGSMVNDIRVGGNDIGASHPLKDGDIITLGSSESQYQYKFILLDVDYK